MKILITGANGQLGTELRRCIARGKHGAWAPAGKAAARHRACHGRGSARHGKPGHHKPPRRWLPMCAITRRTPSFPARRSPMWTAAKQTGMAAFRGECAWARATWPWPRKKSAQSWCMSPRTMCSAATRRSPSGNTTCPRRARSTAKQSCWASSMYGSSARTSSSCARRGCTATRATILSKRCVVWPGRTASVTVVDDQLRQPHQCGGSGPRDLEPAGDARNTACTTARARACAPGASSQQRSSRLAGHPGRGDALHHGAVHRRSTKQIAPAPGVFGAGKRHAAQATVGNEMRRLEDRAGRVF